MRSRLVLCLLLTACGASAQPASTTPDGDPPVADQRAPSDDPTSHQAPRELPERGYVTGPARPLPSAGAEGISGTVSVLTGDHMPPDPSPGGAPYASAPVHVLRGAHAPMTVLDRAAPYYVGTATTDANGVYRAALPAGTYTVLIEHDGEPYLNSYSGDGHWATVTVAAGQWSTRDIQDTAMATF